MTEGTLKTEKFFNDLRNYVISLSWKGWRLTDEQRDDIVSETCLRVWEEFQQLPEYLTRDDERKMFFRAKILFSEAKADFYAASLALSGVSRSAHNAARKALQNNGNSVLRAYANQEGTARVSIQLIEAMFYDHYTQDYDRRGGDKDNPDIGSELVHSRIQRASDRADRSVTSAAEQRSQEIYDAVLDLDEDARTVTLLFMGAEGSPMTLQEIADYMGVDRPKVLVHWQRAKRKLKKALPPPA